MLQRNRRRPGTDGRAEGEFVRRGKAKKDRVDFKGCLTPNSLKGFLEGIRKGIHKSSRGLEFLRLWDFRIRV